PDAIGSATSPDGIEWTRVQDSPVFTPETSLFWEGDRISGPFVLRIDPYYYMLYIGYEDFVHARIGVARSKDGITGWERHEANPLISPGLPGGWESEAVYKPWVQIQPDGSWRMWYNARSGAFERIGVADLNMAEDILGDRNY